MLKLDRPVALKAVDQALSDAEWSESSRRSEDKAADRLNDARGRGPEGTRPVGVIMRAQDGKVDRVALRHHHDDLDSDHPFSGMEIHRSGSFHDLEQDARPMDKTASLVGYFKTAGGDPDLHEKAERYVESTAKLSPHNLDEHFHNEPYEPHPGESDESFEDRRDAYSSITKGAAYKFRRMARHWGQQSEDDRSEYRDRLLEHTKKPLYIATNYAADIISKDGRMKTLAEVGPEKKGDSYFKIRNYFESHIMGIHDDTHPSARPIYGALTDEPHTLWYGEHHLELKPHVRNRTTVTMGDSLDSDLRNYSINKLDELDDAHIVSMTSPDEYDSMKYRGHPAGYMEFQVHGGVHRDDIARLHVHGRLNDRKLEHVKAAMDHGIEVVHHSGRGGPHVLTEVPQLGTRVRASKEPNKIRRFLLNGKIKLDLGRGAFAHYRRGMEETDPIDVFHSGGVRRTTWGGLLALSNGELLNQLPDSEGEPEIGDYFGGEE
jgi:hypothetical protein